MDISTLTKEELETLQSQITTQLSAVEREEIEHQTPEEQLNSLVEYFNKETSSKQVPFTMSLKNTRMQDMFSNSSIHETTTYTTVYANNVPHSIFLSSKPNATSNASQFTTPS